MNLLNNFLLEAGTSGIGSTIALGILIFFAVFVVLGFLFGMKGGIQKATFRLLTVVASAVISFFLTTSLSGKIASLFEGKSVEELILLADPNYKSQVSPEVQNIINCIEPETAQMLIMFFAYLIIIPLVFVIVFAVVKLLTLILFWIFSAIFGFNRKKKGIISRLCGAVIGTAQGAFIAFVILIPLAGFVNIATDVRPTLTDSEQVDATAAEQIDTFYVSYVDDVIESPVIKAVNKMGGHSIFEKVVTFEVNGEKLNTEKQSHHMLKLYADTIILKNFKFTEADPELRDALYTLIADIGDDYFTANIASGLLRSISLAASTEAIVIPFEDPYKSIVLEAIDIFSDSNNDNLKADLLTITNVFCILGENKVLQYMTEGDTQKTLDTLILSNSDNKKVIDLVLDELDNNERTSGLIEVLTKLSVSIMSQQMGLGEDAQQVYENVKTGINDILQIDKNSMTEEEYKAEVSTQLDTTLKENNITLDKEIVDGMADYVSENIAGKEEITDRDVTDTILSYYDAYAKYQETGKLPDELPELPGGGTIPEDLIPGDGTIPEIPGVTTK